MSFARHRAMVPLRENLLHKQPFTWRGLCVGWCVGAFAVYKLQAPKKTLLNQGCDYTTRGQGFVLLETSGQGIGDTQRLSVHTVCGEFYTEGSRLV